MNDVKQVIVIRKDLNMRKGKMIAQGAHASMKVILDKMKQVVERSDINNEVMQIDLVLPIKKIGLVSSSFHDENLEQWILGRFKKVCLSVDSETELIEIYNRAQAAGLSSALITDSGLTEFNGIPTNTCIAIGPAPSSEIDKITGHLKLL